MHPSDSVNPNAPYRCFCTTKRTLVAFLHNQTHPCSVEKRTKRTLGAKPISKCTLGAVLSKPNAPLWCSVAVEVTMVVWRCGGDDGDEGGGDDVDGLVMVADGGCDDDGGGFGGGDGVVAAGVVFGGGGDGVMGVMMMCSGGVVGCASAGGGRLTAAAGQRQHRIFFRGEGVGGY
ncbi:hypothetical protein Tco_1458302, partial [Tanacetum coccineum]